jgi:hypothetical protein
VVAASIANALAPIRQKVRQEMRDLRQEVRQEMQDYWSMNVCLL